MFDIGPEKILVVLAVAMIFLGPERLPGIARQIGTAFRELRGVQDTLQNEIRSAMDPAPEATEPPPAATEPTGPEPASELPESRTFT